MPRADLIVHNAGQLITCASGGKPKRGAEMLDVGMIKDGAAAIFNGKIAAVGGSKQIMAEWEADEHVDAAGRVVSPGFVDPHTHIVYAGDRLNEFELKIRGAEYLDVLAAGGGILSTVRLTREASFEQLVELSTERLDKMLACGTTTCEIKTGYGLDTRTELKMLAVIAELDRTHAVTVIPTFLAAHAVPPEFRGDADSYIDLVCNEMLQLAWSWYESSHFMTDGRPFFCDAFTERNAFSVEQSTRLFEAAAAFGFGIKAHVGQFTDLGGCRASLRSGAVSIDHLDHISHEEISILAASGAICVVIPTENFSAGKTRFADARKLIDSGCAVALSTDFNPGSAPCPSQPMAMAIASRYQRLQPSECLNAATINAAFAIGMGSRVGSIEIGKAADLLLLDCLDHRQLCYEFGGNMVSTVILGGRIVSGG